MLAALPTATFMLLLRDQPVVHERYLRYLTGEAGAAPKEGELAGGHRSARAGAAGERIFIRREPALNKESTEAVGQPLSTYTCYRRRGSARAVLREIHPNPKRSAPCVLMI